MDLDYQSVVVVAAAAVFPHSFVIRISRRTICHQFGVFDRPVESRFFTATCLPRVSADGDGAVSLPARDQYYRAIFVVIELP